MRASRGAEAVRIPGRFGDWVLLRAADMPPWRDMPQRDAVTRERGRGVAPALADAMQRPALRSALRELVGAPSWQGMPPDAALQARVIEAIAGRSLFAVLMPFGADRPPLVRPGHAAQAVPVIREASARLAAHCHGMLLRASDETLSGDPLFPPAAAVLAAWAQDEMPGIGACVRAIHGVLPVSRHGAAGFHAAALLARAAEVLHMQRAARAEEAMDLLSRAADLLDGWPRLAAVLVQMAPDFAPRARYATPDPAPPAPPEPLPPAQPPPAPPDIASPDLAEALRQAAALGIPLVLPCPGPNGP
jgi:hypothetical protein